MLGIMLHTRSKSNSLDYLFYTVPYVREDFLDHFINSSIDMTLVAIYANKNRRFQRLLRRYMDPIFIRRVMNLQPDFRQILNIAHYKINTNGTLLDLKFQVANFVANLEPKGFRASCTIRGYKNF